MKKIIALLCLLALCLPLCACGTSSIAPAEEAKTATAEGATAEKQNAAKPTKKFDIKTDLPKGFAVGHAITDISTVPVPIYDCTATAIQDPLMLTCIAISDGENVALVMTADLKGMQRSVFESTCKNIEKNFGIPADNVMLSCTHTHSAPTLSTGSEYTRFLAKYYKLIPDLVDAALKDMEEIDGCYTGKTNTNGSIAFVRRYLQPDGSYITHGNSKSLQHETTADPELRTIRFDRKTKKDVLLVNFQTHYGGATGMYPEKLSGDFVKPFRDRAEKELDCVFAYYSGAGGNINFNSPIKGEKIYTTFLDAIPEFMRATEAALEAEKEAQVGTIKTASTWYTENIRKDSPERIAQAKEVQSAGRDTAAGKALIAKYGFANKYEPGSVVSRNESYGATLDVPFSCITFGDIAFCAFPYEMFDTNGKECRDASPYDMTFICTLAGGGYGYIPSAFAYPHGGYEVSICRFAAGCGENFVGAMLEILNKCKNAA